MSAVIRPEPGARWPLLQHVEGRRIIAWRGGRGIDAVEFLADVEALANRLPACGSAINLCEDRYAFIVAFCAVASRGLTTLLPPSRTAQAIAEVRAAHAGCCVLSDHAEHAVLGEVIRVDLPAQARSSAPGPMPELEGNACVAIGYTSGSTGQPKPNHKTWGSFQYSCRLNIEAIHALCAVDTESSTSIVATVPAQHMYGIEMSVLLPLLGPFSVHAGRPLFPADIAAALAEVPAPRVLVSTPVHLRNLLDSSIPLPALAGIVSATAPLSNELAARAEQTLGAPVIELFGSTETCVIAARRTATDADWSLYPGIDLQPCPDGTAVRAGHLDGPVLLQDVVEMLGPSRFRLCGRHSDLLEIAGKRASLGDITRRLLNLDGVQDAAAFLLDPCPRTGVQRLAAVVVAPDRCEKELLAELRQVLDPVFLPRPLRRVAALPRNETGKLPRAALLQIVGKSEV